MEEQKEILAFINGPVTDHSRIQDVMFHDPRIHNENGKWQAILGVNTSVKHQNHDYASKLMYQLIEDARKQNRKGCILTCKEELIHYYEKFGFMNLGLSQSTLANETWYDMVLYFEKKILDEILESFFIKTCILTVYNN